MNDTPLSPKSAFWLGFRDMVPFLLIVIPFALLFGAVGTEVGLNIAQTMAFSILVIAGSSQFTAVALMTENAPTFIVLLTSLAVNLRMAMYSAALVPHIGRLPLTTRAIFSYFLVDQTFAMSLNKYEANPGMTLAAKAGYFTGTFCFIAPFWYVFTLVGALVGAQIPAEFALDFAVPICFIALSAPMMRSLPHFVAAITSIIFALLFVNIPYNLGLILAAVIAMIVGAQTEQWLKKRTAT